MKKFAITVTVQGRAQIAEITVETDAHLPSAEHNAALFEGFKRLFEFIKTEGDPAIEQINVARRK